MKTYPIGKDGERGDNLAKYKGTDRPVEVPIDFSKLNRGTDRLEPVPIDFNKFIIGPCLLEVTVQQGKWKGEAVDPANCKHVSSEIEKMPSASRRYLKNHIQFDETAPQDRKS